MNRVVTFADGTELPAIGQGTWFMGKTLLNIIRRSLLCKPGWSGV
ncbi:hypothetical protein ERHA54_28210 [Erwinia rhapontici]|nr:hypothetical protein ERHA54_28210 [Erwinia rhapontici]